ncbi:sialoadhesin-like isoform X1 [Poecilia formosa]|uniref:sialoadhesin-like isoform X1 n=1 Tax=Poecilia formosa TaxID=48698 RepID=UPI0007B985DA|nr:PREDICTED: sialoadhesin-like isoform X1 [Poecilia formosa]
MEGTSVHRLLALISLLSRSTDQVRLTVSPSRSQFFKGESVTLICEDENSSDGGTVRRNTTLETRTECEGWGAAVGSTCNVTYLLQRDTGVYWCESMSRSSSSSSSIQLSVSGGSVILQSPVLPVMEGDDVTLSCRAKSPAHNLPAAFYKDGSFIGDGPSGHMTLLHVSSSDEGLYKCSISGQGESPSSRISVEGESTIPPPSPSSSSSASGRMSLSGNSANQGPLTVNPSRSQFFEFESVTLTCEDDRTVWSNTTRGTKKQCGDAWGTADGSTCKITLLSFDAGQYWCESTSGSISSSSIQLSVSGGSVILQSPVLPVMEGDDVTLSCRAKSPAHNLPAAFYKDGSFIGDGPSGHMTLLHVSSSDEGLYKCSISGQGESPSSRISVEGKHPTTATPTAEATPIAEAPPPPPFYHHVRLLFLLVVICPYIIPTVLMVSLFRQRNKANNPPVSEEMTPSFNATQELDDVYENVITGVTTEHHF